MYFCRARGILEGAIKLNILLGLVHERVAADHGSAFRKYKEAYDTINLARERWPNEITHEGCGTSMRRTFSQYDLDHLFFQYR